MSRAIKAALLIICVGLVVAAPSLFGSEELEAPVDPPDRADPGTGSDLAAAGFESCDELQQYLADQPARLTAYTTGIARSSGPIPLALESADAIGAGGPIENGSNVQEAGVGEPDVVKLVDGNLLRLAKRRLDVIAPSGGEPVTVGSLDLRDQMYPESILVAGERAFVLGTPRVPPRKRGLDSMLAEIDISDPATPTVRSTEIYDGTIVTARSDADSVRLVTSPALPDPLPLGRGGKRIELDDAPLPEATFQAAGEAPSTRQLVDCTAVRRPAQPAGAGLLTVITIDAGQGLPASDTDAIAASGEIAYGAPGAIYIATSNSFGPLPIIDSRPPRPRDRGTTEIHKFSYESPSETSYAGSGEVDGYMLSQWSMSEHDGVLRVASTTQPFFRRGDRAPQQQSLLTVLERRDGELAEIGRLEGLGPEERIYAVRFFGDRAFVVTFRETDPLYSLDLSDPASPALAGELKIPGYSAYLHPVGEDLLLGVGQDADNRGRLKGVQLSLFDVSDPAAPLRTDQLTVAPKSFTPVEFEHLAFSYDAETELAFVPYTAAGQGRDSTGGIGAFAAGPSGPLEERALLAERGLRTLVQKPRTIVFDDHAYTFFGDEVIAYELDALTETGSTG